MNPAERRELHEQLDRLIERCDKQVVAISINAEEEDATLAWMSARDSETTWGPVAFGAVPQSSERVAEARERGWFVEDHELHDEGHEHT